MKKQIVHIAAILTIFSLLLAACAAQPTAAPAPVNAISTTEVVAEGRLEPIHATNLTFLSKGVVEQVFVSAGDTVKQGDVLARLTNAGGAEAQVLLAQNTVDTLLRNEGGDRAKIWQAYMAAQVARAAAEKKWEGVDVDTIETNVEDDKATVEDRRKDLTDAQDEFDKYKDLDKDNSKRKTAKDNLEKAQEDLNQAIRDLEATMRERDDVKAAYDSALGVEAEAKHQYENSLDGPNVDQLTLAKTQLDAALDALSNYVLTAPFDGVVADVSIKAGEQVGTDTRAISIADFSKWTVETTDITELEVVKLSIGQKVTLVPDALPDLILKGTITEISQAYTQQGGDILYTVKIQVENPEPVLRWGMTVEATFLDAPQ
jgi:multidrug efflux pump subunit AcrA (membrane-fusion protein)